MGEKKRFDFDAFAAKATFDEVRDLMVESRRLPSMRSPDGGWLFLSSIDEVVATNNAKDIRRMIDLVKERLSQVPPVDHSKRNDIDLDLGTLEAMLAYL
jgi:hypothetical protein